MNKCKVYTDEIHRFAILKSNSNIDTKKLSSFEKNANFHTLDLGFFAKNRPSDQKKRIMITGLKKKQKTTEIYFNEADDITTITTYNTKLKNRLKVYVNSYVIKWGRTI